MVEPNESLPFEVHFSNGWNNASDGGIWRWLKSNVGQEGTEWRFNCVSKKKTYSYLFAFRKETDAVLFKTIWS